MNFFKPDGPVMSFISTVTDLLLLNLVFIVCCIPIFTIGASYSAMSYVAMKIVRGEEPKVFGPFFKAFKRNFKQATISWIIFMAVIFLLFLDWRWIILTGWNSVPFMYKLGAVFMSAFAWLMILSIFPMIARYEMKTLELFKASFMIAIIKFIPLMLITALMIASVVACIWYMQWFPLIYVFCSLTVMYFLAVVFVKQFDKLENKQAEQAENKTDDDGIETIDQAESEEVAEDVKSEDSEDQAVGEGDFGYAKSVRELHKEIEADKDKEDEVVVEDTSGNKLTRFMRREKKKLGDLDGKQKFIYFIQYYFPITILIVLVIVAAIWYGHDVYKSKMRVLTGGLINCSASEEGQKYATEDFLKWAGYSEKRTAVLQGTDLNFTSDDEFEEQYMGVALKAQIFTGAFDYLILREDAVDNYVSYDNFEDLRAVTDVTKFDEGVVYSMEHEEKDNITGKTTKEDVPLALKLSDDTEVKLGLDPEYDYYIAFAYQMGPSSYDAQEKFVDYLFALG